MFQVTIVIFSDFRVTNFSFRELSLPAVFFFHTSCKDTVLCNLVDVNITYWATSFVSKILKPHQKDNDINPLAAFVYFKSLISLTNEFNTTPLSEPVALRANNKSLNELTISSTSSSI